MRKSDSIFGDSSDCDECHCTERITFSFVHTIREIIIVSTVHTYKRGTFGLTHKPTIPARDDSKISWGTGERTFKINMFQYEDPGFKVSAIAKFDMLHARWFSLLAIMHRNLGLSAWEFLWEMAVLGSATTQPYRGWSPLPMTGNYGRKRCRTMWQHPC